MAGRFPLHVYATWTDLVYRWRHRIHGVIFVGANTGQELNFFASIGILKLIAFEPTQDAFEKLCQSCTAICANDSIYDYRAVNCALGSAPGTGRMYLASNGLASSSLLRPSRHLSAFPDIHFDGMEDVVIKTLDESLSNMRVNLENFNTIIMDVQGFELKVLSGAPETLKRMRFVISEVLHQELYLGSPKESEIDEALVKAGFLRVWKKSMGSYGDAAYVQSKLGKLNHSDYSWTVYDIWPTFLWALRTLKARLKIAVSTNFLLAPVIGVYKFFRYPSLRIGFMGPMNGQRHRVAAFRELNSTFNFDAIIETGTYRATTTEFFSQETKLPVYSCELVREMYWYSRFRLRKHQNVRLFRMDSRNFLMSIGANSPSFVRPFCYLDAHWNAELPLWEEIMIVWKFWPNAIIMIDDFAVPGDPGFAFDDYGENKTLDFKTLKSQVRVPFDAFFPLAKSAEESGLRRGSIVLAKQEALTRKMKQIGSLRGPYIPEYD